MPSTNLTVAGLAYMDCITQMTFRHGSKEIQKLLTLCCPLVEFCIADMVPHVQYSSRNYNERIAQKRRRQQTSIPQLGVASAAAQLTLGIEFSSSSFLSFSCHLLFDACEGMKREEICMRNPNRQQRCCVFCYFLRRKVFY